MKTKWNSLKGALAVALAAAASAIVIAGFCGCDIGGKEGSGAASLYAVDTRSGKVYQIDAEAAVAAESPLVTVGQNASGELAFSSDYGFIAVASGNNDAPGLYRFEPGADAPSASLVGASLSVQFVRVVSDEKGFATVADYSSPESNGLYAFDPANSGAGLARIVDSARLQYPQDLAVGADGYLYVADNPSVLSYDYSSGEVLKIDMETGAVAATIKTTLGGTTGLLAGSFDGKRGIFVANTGSYDAANGYSAVKGSIDFIPSDAADGSTAVSVIADIPAARLASLDESTLVVTGGYPSATGIVTLDGGTVSYAEVRFEGASFGSMDVDVVDGVAYVPDGANTIYAVRPDGSVAAIRVGADTVDGITNVGVRESAD